MLIFEPQLRCMSAGNNDKDDYFLDRCEASKPIYLFPYTVFAMLGMLWYYVLMVDLAVFNNKVSAHVLVCGCMVQGTIVPRRNHEHDPDVRKWIELIGSTFKRLRNIPSGALT